LWRSASDIKALVSLMPHSSLLSLMPHSCASSQFVDKTLFFHDQQVGASILISVSSA